MDTIIDTTQLFADLDAVWADLLFRVSDNSYNVNAIPFVGSWTIAQLAAHVTKSNRTIDKGMHMQGAPAHRDLEANVHSLKNTFLNFEKKLQSPDFIVPEEKNYVHSDMVEELAASVEALKKDRTSVDLTGHHQHESARRTYKAGAIVLCLVSYTAAPAPVKKYPGYFKELNTLFFYKIIFADCTGSAYIFHCTRQLIEHKIFT